MGLNFFKSELDINNNINPNPYNYKILKCSICDDQCYCFIKKEQTEIKKTDILTCLIGSESKWISKISI